ncbi:hypothetical protein EGH10_14315 [Brevibacillus laterosporus]|nr:hypothetical protein DM460_03770 [Brevibacillus laterosporus]TPH09443.1 hypothetical protein EGH10_14315 [Brevibacillus laterosporus]
MEAVSFCWVKKEARKAHTIYASRSSFWGVGFLFEAIMDTHQECTIGSFFHPTRHSPKLLLSEEQFFALLFFNKQSNRPIYWESF